MKKTICPVLVILLVLVLLAGCQGHSHTYDTKWMVDSAEHWHQATCEHTDQESDRGIHVDADLNNTCDVCGYGMNHICKYESKWTWTEQTHYYKNTCGHEDTSEHRKDEAPHTDGDNDGLCDICHYDYDHKHSYAVKWTAAEGGHWHAPTCGHSVPGADLTAHADNNNDGSCDDCGFNDGHVHTYAPDWSTDSSNHWKAVTCGHSIARGELGKHADEDGNGLCDVCSYASNHFHSFDDTWAFDKNSHWYPATCGHTSERKDEAPHVSSDGDGICDVCQYAIYNTYDISVQMPGYVKLVDENGDPLTATFRVREGTAVSFYLVVPSYAKLEGIQGTQYDPKPQVNNGEFLYKISLVVDKDIAITATVNKRTAVDVVDSEGMGYISCPASGEFTTDITFHAAESGRYGVFCLSDERVQFGRGDSFAKYYVFDVAQPGAVSIQARYFAEFAQDKNFTYYLCKMEDQLVLPQLEGSGYILPAVLPVYVTFTLSEPGTYQLTSTWNGLAWDDDITQPKIITTTVPNQKVTIQVRRDVLTYPMSPEGTTYEFDWKIEPIGGTSHKFQQGENAVTVIYGSLTSFVFTAEQDGAYSFTKISELTVLKAWDEAAGTVLNTADPAVFVLRAGEQIKLYLGVDAQAAEHPEDVEDVVSVTYLGHVPQLNPGAGAYPAVAGISNNFLCEVSGEYEITMPAGGQFSLDGGITWQESLTVALEQGQVLSYLVQGAAQEPQVLITIARISYEFTLGIGDTSVTMTPGKEYTVALTGAQTEAFFKTYILIWSEDRLTVRYEGRELDSGDEIAGYSDSYRIYMTYHGQEAAEISFYLMDMTASEDSPEVLHLGAIGVTTDYYGREFVFTSESGGMYRLSAAQGDENAYILVDGSQVELPWEFSLEAGMSCTFVICTASDAGSDQIDLLLEQL